MYQGVSPTPPRLSALWAAIRDRLEADVTMRGYLGGSGRVDLSYEPIWQGAGENVQWTRIVVVPIVRAYPVEDLYGASVLAPFLVRVDLHGPGDIVPIEKGELVHIRAFELLHGWLPEGLEDVQVRHRIYRETTPEAIPVADPESDVSFMSAEYRVLAESPDV